MNAQLPEPQNALSIRVAASSCSRVLGSHGGSSCAPPTGSAAKPARTFGVGLLAVPLLVVSTAACGAPQQRDLPVSADAPTSPGLHAPNGSLASARVLEAGPATAPLQIYRVYSTTAGKAGADGLYWAPVAPQGSREKYRGDYVICPEWNDLERVRTCTVRPWALLAVGPGAAATCKDGTVLPASPVEQILLIPKWNNAAQQYQLPVDGCTDATATWAP